MADRFSFRNPSNGDYTTIHPEIWKQEIKEKYDFATQTHDEIVIGFLVTFNQHCMSSGF